MTSLFFLAGRGSRKGAAQMCMSCHGTGMQVRMHQLIPGMVQQVSTVCHSCQGQGQRISNKDRCKACAGRKILRQKKILEVHIDKGDCLYKSISNYLKRKLKKQILHHNVTLLSQEWEMARRSFSMEKATRSQELSQGTSSSSWINENIHNSPGTICYQVSFVPNVAYPGRCNNIANYTERCLYICIL